MDRSPGLLLTDLYQLTMLHGYQRAGMRGIAVFEFFVRSLPPVRRFLMAAGLEQLLDYLETARFTESEIEWLASTGRFPRSFLDELAGWRFEGEVHALPEGTLFFPGEPVVRVTAPIQQAQLLESRLINLLHFQILIASKAIRCRLAAPGKRLVDFGMRRAHGAEAACLAARAAYLAGFDATATLLAGRRFGIPVSGTMAHSFVEAHPTEGDAFLDFARAQPDNVILLIDTYDTEAGAREAVRIAPQLAAEGIAIQAVRLDSGDLAEHARRVRAILDEGGLQRTSIFSSGNLDEQALRAFVADQVPIDGFGVGTLLDTSADAPYLDCAYKLTEYAGRPCRKTSEGKESWPGRRQIFRACDERGRMAGDIVGLEAERQPGEPLLRPVMREGVRLEPPPSLARIRRRVTEAIARLPEPLRAIDPGPAPYPVTISPALRALAERADAERRRA